MPPSHPMTRKGQQNLDLTFRAQHVWMSIGLPAFQLCALNLAEDSLRVTDEETGSGLQQHLCPKDTELAIQRQYPSSPGFWEARNGPSGAGLGYGLLTQTKLLGFHKEATLDFGFITWNSKLKVQIHCHSVWEVGVVFSK